MLLPSFICKANLQQTMTNFEPIINCLLLCVGLNYILALWSLNIIVISALYSQHVYNNMYNDKIMLKQFSTQDFMILLIAFSYLL